MKCALGHIRSCNGKNRRGGGQNKTKMYFTQATYNIVSSVLEEVIMEGWLDLILIKYCHLFELQTGSGSSLSLLVASLCFRVFFVRVCNNGKYVYAE